MIGPGRLGSMNAAMVRASARPDGVTAPSDSGFSIQVRMKRTSSSSRMPFFSSKRRIWTPNLRFCVSSRCSNLRRWLSNCCSILRSSAPFFCSNS
jgi:hypothetical protein